MRKELGVLYCLPLHLLLCTRRQEEHGAIQVMQVPSEVMAAISFMPVTIQFWASS